MIEAQYGTVAAGYEYDAFGRTLRSTGTYAAANTFRFSTKATDEETGLVYYGHRYYSPSLGRFVNRDPIGEQGGLNIYAFCGNNGINSYDLLGLVREEIELDGGYSSQDGLGYIVPDREDQPPVVANPREQSDAIYRALLRGNANPTPEERQEARKKADDLVNAANGRPVSVTAVATTDGAVTEIIVGTGPARSQDIAYFDVASGELRPITSDNRGQSNPAQGWHAHSAITSALFLDPLAAAAAHQKIINDFRHFGSFNDPIQNAATVVVKDGYALFDLKGAEGFISDHIGNSDKVRVNLSETFSGDGLHFSQTAVTVGNHQLVGVRTWFAALSADGLRLDYGTYAIEQPRGWINQLGFQLGPGRSAQIRIWEIYLTNIQLNNRLPLMPIRSSSNQAFKGPPWE